MGNPLDTFHFVTYKTAGIVRDFMQTINLTDPQWAFLTTDTPDGRTMVNKLGNLIWTHFIGGNRVANEAKAIEDDRTMALRNLRSLKLCDLCYLPEYLCEFEKWFYKIDPSLYDNWKDKIFDDIPGVWGGKMKDQFEEADRIYFADNLGGRIKFVKEWLQSKCEENRTMVKSDYNRFLRNCCGKFYDDGTEPGHWGCKPSRRNYKRKGRKKYRFRRYKYRKYYQNRNRKPYRRKFYRKRYQREYQKKEEGDNKGKYCLRGKTNCRCWICNEEGHYANNCPNKRENSSKYKKDLKVLEEIYRMNYEPIEDLEVSESESIYVLETDTEDSETETSSFEESRIIFIVYQLILLSQTKDF